MRGAGSAASRSYMPGGRSSVKYSSSAAAIKRVKVVPDKQKRKLSFSDDDGIHRPITLGIGKMACGLKIFDPRSKPAKRWDGMVALLLVYTAYVTPYEVRLAAVA